MEPFRVSRLKRAGLTMFCLGICAVTNVWAKESGSWDARITSVSGEVSVTPNGAEAVAAQAGLPIVDGDKVATAAGASAEISLDGESLITLGENTEFTMRKSAKKASTFELALGSILAKIQKLGKSKLSVKTPTAVLAVRGTEFGVDIDGQQSRVGVFDEGKVEVSGEDGRGAQTLTANQETFVPRGGPPRQPEPLRVFAQRREMMRNQIHRLQEVRHEWRQLPRTERGAVRRQMMNRGGPDRGNRRGQDRRGPGAERGGPGRNNDQGGPQQFGPRGNDDGRRGPPRGGNGNDGGPRRPPPGGGPR